MPSANIIETQTRSEKLKTTTETDIPLDQQKWSRALELFCNDTSLLNPEERLEWLQTLGSYLEQTIETGTVLNKKLLELVIRFSGLLCDWQLQIFALQKLPGLQSVHIELLAYAFWKIGHWQNASELLERHMLLSADDQNLYKCYCMLNELSDEGSYLNYQRVDISKLLRLELMSCHHGNEFLWQYFDPQIAQLCCLPEFDESYTWSDWLQYQQSLTDQNTFAVIHQHWGFVGVVSLVAHQNVGYFYYWLGKDFRGQGFGGEAVSLLLEFGCEYLGINCCYAKVFEHNSSSQKAMEKLGFQRLPFNAAPPNETEQLYYLGSAKSPIENALECQQLFDDMCSATKVDIPLSMKLYYD